MDVLHTLIAIAVAILLIIRFRIDPVISLIISSIYLGLAAGVGLKGTADAITTGFGDIMAEVGLLIGFGVLIGALLQATGTFRDLVHLIAERVGNRLPYAMAAALSIIFPSIYVDVQVVLASPMARQAAPVIDKRRGLPWLAGSIAVGIFAGYVFVVPGLAAVAVAGLLDLPLGTYLIFGAPIGLGTALLVAFLFRQLLRTGYWDARTDIDESEIEHPDHPDHAAWEAIGTEGEQSAAGATTTATDEVPEKAARMPLLLRLTPILVPLVLIAVGAFTELFDVSTPVLAFLGNANIALFIGLLVAFVLARATLGTDHSGEAMTSGFRTTGEILLITGIGGSLGAVITETGLDKTLKGLFSADASAPILLSVLLSWFIAALLHFAIGSVSVGAITAAGIIAPVVSQIGVDPVVIALAIASGAMFALHVNSNFFWMFKTLLGLSTKGALKTLTMATSLGALVSLPLVLVVSVIA
ncbi:GntP family permease [Janibacter corallicola]|uniref:GntP family permease n=1 Tax=Janibacter corallicola TaxID=415212 RepID=UPI00083594C8|nr:gluconate transporter [Janibacter corallicola]